MITVRHSTRQDLPFIKEMMWEASLASPVLIRSKGLERMKEDQERYWNDWIEKDRPGFIALAENGPPLGALTLRPHIDWRSDVPTWELGIGVANSARRQGVGQALLEYALDFCRETDQPYLALTVDPTNRIAQALYRKVGFKIISKRHGVIEMRYNFTPSPPEDPEIVAKRRYFLEYWSKREYYSGRYNLHHCKPYHMEHRQFKQRGVKPNDWVYIISVIDGGLHLIAKYEVDELLTYEEVKAKFEDSDDFDPKSDHVLAGRSTLYSFEPPIDLEATQALCLLEKGVARPLPFESEGRLKAARLRGLREITGESAFLLDGFVEQLRGLYE